MEIIRDSVRRMTHPLSLEEATRLKKRLASPQSDFLPSPLPLPFLLPFLLLPISMIPFILAQLASTSTMLSVLFIPMSPSVILLLNNNSRPPPLPPPPRPLPRFPLHLLHPIELQSFVQLAFEFRPS